MIIKNDVEKFRNKNPSLFRFLKGFSLIRDVVSSGSTPYKIEIILCKFCGEDAEDLKITFLGAADIKINEVESLFGMFLTIEDIRVRQLEGLSYHVCEVENNTFSFDCSDFYAEFL